MWSCPDTQVVGPSRRGCGQPPGLAAFGRARVGPGTAPFEAALASAEAGMALAAGQSRARQGRARQGTAGQGREGGQEDSTSASSKQTISSGLKSLACAAIENDGVEYRQRRTSIRAIDTSSGGGALPVHSARVWADGKCRGVDFKRKGGEGGQGRDEDRERRLEGQRGEQG